MTTSKILSWQKNPTRRHSRVSPNDEMLKSTAGFLFSKGIQPSLLQGCRNISTQVFPLQFKASPCLWSEPLKKKRKIDPGVMKQREERKKKKILREIRRLERCEKQLKPIAECETPPCLKKELNERRRQIQVPSDVAEERILLLKQWSNLKYKEGLSDWIVINRLMKSQRRALDELRLESEELYQAAVRIDEHLVPFKFVGPTETPAIDDYPMPDGAYVDESRKW